MSFSFSLTKLPVFSLEKGALQHSDEVNQYLVPEVPTRDVSKIFSNPNLAKNHVILQTLDARRSQTNETF